MRYFSNVKDVCDQKQNAKDGNYYCTDYCQFLRHGESWLGLIFAPGPEDRDVIGSDGHDAGIKSVFRNSGQTQAGVPFYTLNFPLDAVAGGEEAAFGRYA